MQSKVSSIVRIFNFLEWQRRERKLSQDHSNSYQDTTINGTFGVTGHKYQPCWSCTYNRLLQHRHLDDSPSIQQHLVHHHPLSLNITHFTHHTQHTTHHTPHLKDACIVNDYNLHSNTKKKRQAKKKTDTHIEQVCVLSQFKELCQDSYSKRRIETST